MADKTAITIRIDNDVLAALKALAGGRGYQTLINDALREYVQGVNLSIVVDHAVRESLATWLANKESTRFPMKIFDTTTL